MKSPIQFLVAASLITVAGISAQSDAAGTWTTVTALAPAASGGGMILMSDGTVLCKTSSGGGDGIGNVWVKLKPSSTGSYQSGTWSPLATVPAMSFTRLYFSSQLLKDGRLYVCGGEYGTGLTSAGEVYNPLTNSWTLTPSPNGGSNISDANSEIMPDGRIMQAVVSGTLRNNKIYNPTTNTYIAGPTCTGIHNESEWCKLPDNSFLMVNRLTTQSERWIPSSNTWVNDAVVPVALYDSFGLETGGGALLPNGKAFFPGANSATGIYTPSGTNAIGSWVAGPNTPNANGCPDAPLCMMPDGKVIVVTSPIPTSANHFPSPTSFYEYDYVTNSYTQVNGPTGLTLNTSCYIYCMLQLPNGQVLFSTQGSTRFYLYTPAGSPAAAWKPTITDVAQNNCGDYTLTGTQLNGISEGASYGDDWQMNTNYPIIRLTSGANVYYCRTFNWSHTGVKLGATVNTTKFTVPSTVPAGTYSLVVTANGIPSTAISFDYTPTRSCDIDGDGFVDGADIGLVLLDFGPCAGCSTDIDMDGVVDGADVGLMLLSEGPCL
ncbi:MAG: hypothetical protein K8R92_07100 [Planctomycetes bacterium]|nr:hypothetical protein [Planctomycetota bacterium]